jgi:hypothetical protein
MHCTKIVVQLLYIHNFDIQRKIRLKNLAEIGFGRKNHDFVGTNLLWKKTDMRKN